MSSRAPRVVAALGLLGLLGSTACFPLPNIVLPGSGPRPTPEPVIMPRPATSAGATPTAPPSVSTTVYPTPGRKYTILDRKGNATRVYTITSVQGSLVYYDLNASTVPGTSSHIVTQTNGVFWTEAGASPTTKDIEQYERETITVQAGTFPCFKVVSGANTFWFCGGICVKGAGADVDFELTKLE